MTQITAQSAGVAWAVLGFGKRACHHPRARGTKKWLSGVGGDAEARRKLSPHLSFISDPWKGFSEDSEASGSVHPRTGPGAFGLLSSPSLGSSLTLELCLDLLSEDRTSRKCWHLTGQPAGGVPDSWQPAGPAPSPGGYRLQAG